VKGNIGRGLESIARQFPSDSSEQNKNAPVAQCRFCHRFPPSFQFSSNNCGWRCVYFRFSFHFQRRLQRIELWRHGSEDTCVPAFGQAMIAARFRQASVLKYLCLHWNWWIEQKQQMISKEDDSL
jgi:hypothetical protein